MLMTMDCDNVEAVELRAAAPPKHYRLGVVSFCCGDSEPLPVSEAERHELDDRLREDDEQPELAIPWDEARTQLRNGQ
jgi:hypothetical protein